MAMSFLEFEQPIAELEAKIEELKFLGDRCERQYFRGNQALTVEKPRIDDEHFCELEPLADYSTRAPPAATLYARLRRDDLHRLA